MRLPTLLIGAIVLIATSTTSLATPALADPDVKIDPAITSTGEHRVIVRMRHANQVNSALAAVEAIKKDKKNIAARPPANLADRLDFFVYNGTRADVEKIARRPDVLTISEDRLNAPSLAESVPLIGADHAHQANVTGQGTALAILDSGFDLDHPALGSRIVEQACFSAVVPNLNASSLCPNGAATQTGPGSADAEVAECVTSAGQQCTHGTIVAGIAAGQATAGFPSDGVAPGAQIIAIQVYSRFRHTPLCRQASQSCVLSFDSSILTAMAYVELLAEQYTIAAVNLSANWRVDLYPLGPCDDVSGQNYKVAMDSLLAKGIPTVVATGNNGFNFQVQWPACVSSAVSVSATDKQDAIAPFANRGVVTDLFAPGDAITAAALGGGYLTSSGTSLAAAHVSGAFALLRQKHPDATADELLTALKTTGKPFTYSSWGDTQVTTPRIDVAAALISLS